jgi:hypothetical protein
VHGTLSFASRDHDAGDGDWVGCAQALVDHGLPVEQIDDDYSDEWRTFFAARARNESSGLTAGSFRELPVEMKCQAWRHRHE